NRRAAEQRDESATFHVEHRGLPPMRYQSRRLARAQSSAASPAAGRPARAGAELKCSESKRRRPAPQVPQPDQDSTWPAARLHADCLRRLMMLTIQIVGARLQGSQGLGFAARNAPPPPSLASARPAFVLGPVVFVIELHCVGSVFFTIGHHEFCWSRINSAVSAGDVARRKAPSVSNFCCSSG